MNARLFVWLMVGLLALEFGLAPGGASAFERPKYTQFVTLDANRHFVNENGPFVGYGIHYNQIYGGQHYYEVTDYDLDLMARDLDALAARGMTNVTLRVWWGVYVNPATRAKALDQWQKALDLIQAHGLYATIWFDPANSWPRQIPAEQRWDTAVRQDNWNLFLDHVRDFADRYKDRKCIIGYNINNEAVATIHPEMLVTQLPEFLQHFQDFIAQKYGAIQAYNAKWGTAYASFQTIQLPAFDPKTYAFTGVQDQLVEYNYFREQFVSQRDQEAAAAVHSVAPSHLVWAGALSACGGSSLLFEYLNLGSFTNFNLLSTGVYPAEFQDGGFCKSYQSILCPLRVTRPFLSFGQPAVLSETGIADEYSGTHSTDQQMADWNQTNWADMVGDGGTAIDLWDYNSFAYPGYLTKTGAPDYNNAQFVDCGNFTRAMAGVDVKFTVPTPQVLLLRNKAVNNSNSSTWLDQGNFFAVADWLYQLHVPYDVRTEADINSSVLDAYKVVVVCNQTTLYEDTIYGLLRGWAEAKPGRVLVNGFYFPRDGWFQTKSRCADMKTLTGIPSDSYSIPWHGMTGERMAFVFKKPFGTLAVDDRVTFTLVANSWDIPTPLAATAEVLAELSSKPGTPLLVRNNLPGGSKVYTFGVPPGLVWWSVDGEPGPVVHDGMVPIYRQILAEAGITPAFEAPTNLGAYVTSDQSAMLFKERYAEPTDAILTADLGGAVYDVASCDVEASGKVTLHAAVRAHGWLVARRLGLALSPQSGTAHVAVSAHEPNQYRFSLSGPSSCRVTASGLAASAPFEITIGQTKTGPVTSSAAGVVSFDVPAGTHAVSLAPVSSRSGKEWVIYN